MITAGEFFMRLLGLMVMNKFCIRASDEGLDEERQSPDGSALKWVRRLQAQVEKHERAEQATLARLQNELQMLKHSEEVGTQNY